MLKIMYRGWAENNKCRVTETDGVLTIEGENLAGLEQEHGVHRLVRMSPHDPQNRRHTTFCKVLVGEMPDIEWGNSIRSYVLAPYKLAKNTVTEKQTGDVAAVLSGRPNLLWASTANDQKLSHPEPKDSHE